MGTALLRGPFLVTTVANFCFFMSFATYFLLPLHIQALGGSKAWIGAVMGAAGLASLLVMPAIGLSLDRWGRRPFLIAGALGMTAASLGFYATTQLGAALFACRVLQGVSFAAAFTAATTFAAEFAPAAHRARALGIFGLSTLLTHAIAPIVGEEIVHRLGFPPLFLLTTAYTAVAVLLALRLPAGGPRRGASVSADRRLQAVHWIVAAAVTCAGMGFGTVVTFVAAFVTSEALGRIAVFFGAYTGTAIMTRLIGAGLSDTFGRRRVVVPTLTALGISILLLAAVHGIGGLVVAGALFGTAQGISYPTLHAFLVDWSTDAQLGRSQALFNGAFNLGVTGSAFGFGLVAEHYGYRLMFTLAAAMPIVAAIIFGLGTARADALAVRRGLAEPTLRPTGTRFPS